MPSPYAQAMLDFWHGRADAAYTIRRDDGFSQLVPVAPSFAGPPFHPIEQQSLDRATGRVLDVGAGAGRHTLSLQERGCRVTAIETAPELAGIMSGRGVAEALTGDLTGLAGRQFDTILMLMNGFGLVGTLIGAATFFRQAGRLLSPGGQILCDSLDVRCTTNPVHLAYQQANLSRGQPAGQMRFWIEYGGRQGRPFDWLHLDFGALRDLSRSHGWSAERLSEEAGGRYLARLNFAEGHVSQRDNHAAVDRHSRIAPAA